MIVVAKIGTSSVTTSAGVNVGAVEKLAREVASLVADGHRVVIVSSGAVTAGLAVHAPGGERPTDPTTLRALSAIGQHRLMRVYDDAFEHAGLLTGQVLLAASDFTGRHRYLNARSTLERMLELGVVPVINENDPVVDDEIRFGDNDRLAALVTNLIGADLLVLLTDIEGVFDADPRIAENASLVEEVAAIDDQLMAAAGGAGTKGGSGGMVSKLAAARIASSSGVRVVITNAARSDVLIDAVQGRSGIGTTIAPLHRELSARKLWIAFACIPSGRVVVDAGAVRALGAGDASLLPAGVTHVEGNFGIDDAIEILGPDRTVIGKGIARLAALQADDWLSKRTSDLPEGLAHEVIHRDDLVILVGDHGERSPGVSRPTPSTR